MEESGFAQEKDSFAKRFKAEYDKVGGSFPIYAGLGLIVLFIFVISLAPIVSEDFGELLIKKRSQDSLAARTSPVPTVVMAVTPNPPIAAQAFIVSGTGFTPLAAVNFVLGGFASYAQADSTGYAWETWTIALPGNYTIVAKEYTSKGWVQVGSITFDVIAAPSPSPSPTPPPPPDPESDFDGDGFTYSVEIFVGTDPNDACSNTSVLNDEAVDAFPPDLNDDQQVTLADTLLFNHYFN